jgi:RNA polymerase sigma-70 factor, ECF subfamily
VGDWTLTTTKLLDELRESDGRVWSSFDERYRPIVRGVAMRMGLRPEDAADVAQQTLMDFFQGYRAGRYERGKGRLRTWVMTIARRRATDVLRETYRRGPIQGESSAMELPDDVTVAQAWEAEEHRLVCEKALELLHTETRAEERTLRVFELLVLQQVPPGAVAEQVGMSIDQVYVIKNRTLKRLRELTKQVQDSLQADE